MCCPCTLAGADEPCEFDAFAGAAPLPDAGALDDALAAGALALLAELAEELLAESEDELAAGCDELLLASDEEDEGEGLALELESADELDCCAASAFMWRGT